MGAMRGKWGIWWSRLRRLVLIPIFAMLGATLVVVGTAASPSSAATTPESCFTYNNLFNTSTGTIGGYNIADTTNCTTTVNIPSTISGVPVLAITGAAFLDYGIVSVTIPNTVTTIGNRAFEQTGNNSNATLTSVTLGSSVTSIGTQAFNNNKLTSLTIPNSVTSIGDKAFKNQGPASYSAGAGATLTSLTFQSGGSAPLTIGSEAFRNTALATVDIPDRVTTISDQAFMDDPSMVTLRVGTGVTSIGSKAFTQNYAASSGATTGSLTNAIFRGNKPFFGNLSTGVPANPNPFNATGTTNWYYWNTATGWTSSSATGHTMSGVDPPTIASFSPTSGSVAGGTDITITGTNFVDGATATVGGTGCASTTFVNSTSLICRTAASTAGSGLAVSVTNPIPNVATKTGFTYFDSQSAAIGTTTVTGANELTVNWANPDNSVVGYTVEASTDAGSSWSAVSSGTCSSLSSSGPATSCTATGLTAKTDYQFRVTSTYTGGPAAASGASTTVTTATAPDAPTIGTTTKTGNLELTVNWTPNSANNSPVTSQTVEFVSNGDNTITSGTCANVSAGATSCTATGLSNSTAYVFRVKATNAAGTSSYSADSASVTTQIAPGAPTITSVADSCGMVSVFFTAPAANGSPSITTYQYSTDGGTTWVNRASTSTTSPLSITALSNNGTTALTNGTTYPVQIRAYSGAPGAPSATVNGMARNSSTSAPTQTYTVPAGVTAVKIVATGGGGGGGSSVSSSRQGGNGGAGGMVTTTQPVTPGHTLNIKTGGGGCGAGTSSSSGPGGSGSANGGAGGTGGTGGKHGGGAGGATTIMDSDGSSVQIIVGGGGGGGGSGSSGAGTPGGAGGGSSSTPVANGSTGTAGGGTGGGTGTDSGSAAAGSTGSSTSTTNMGGGGGGGAGYAGGQGGPTGAGGSPGGRGGGGGSSKVTTTVGSESTSYTFGTAPSSGGAAGNAATSLAGVSGVGGYVTITPLPTATSAAATSVASTSATLNGAVSANDSAITSVTCRYSTTNTDSAIDAATPVTAATPSVPTSATASGAAATCSTTGLAASTTYYFKVYATSSAGTTGSNITSFTTAAATPANTAVPTITGTATTGQTLTAHDGTWTGEPAPTFSYQWQQCTSSDCSTGVSDISSATTSTFALTNSQIGTYVRVQVTGTNTAGTATAYSTPTTAIAGIAPANTAVPTITGTTTTGQNLTAHDGTWTGEPAPTFSYQWQQCTSSDCSTGVSDISSATTSTFALTNTQIGTYIRVKVTGHNTTSPDATAYSTPTTAIAGIAPANTAVPPITGTTTTGQDLTAHDGTWTGEPAPTFSYQWQQCTSSDCSTGVSDISSATTSTFALTNTQIGTYIRVKVTGTNSAGTATAYSTPTAAIAGIAPAVTHGVEVAGTPVSGQTLTASADTWSGEPTPTVGYQWQQCSVANCGDAIDIPSATSTTFVLTDSQIGKYVRVKATGHNSTSPDAVSFSLASGPIAANTIAPANTGLPLVSGVTVSGSVLSTTDGSWTGTSPITYGYQWQTCSTADCSGGTVTNVGTNSASLTLSPSHVGTYARVIVTAHNSAADVTATSTPTAVITGLALTPTLGTPVSTADGYTFTITNYDTAFTWVGTATNGGSVGIVTNNNGTATATVTNLTPSAPATTTITTTRTNYATGTSTLTGTAKAAPPAGDTAVTVTTPVTQFVIGQQVPVTVDITSGATKTSTRSSSVARTALADADGTATISVNGTPACTATVTNGRGSCAVTIRSNGTQRFTATFTGTLNGQTVTLATTTPTKATAATVSLLAATGRVRGCRINATIAGRALTANRTITIQTRRGGTWTTLTTTRTNNKKNWKTTLTLPGTSLKIRAKDKNSTTAERTITLTGTHKPNQRGC